MTARPDFSGKTRIVDTPRVGEGHTLVCHRKNLEYRTHPEFGDDLGYLFEFEKFKKCVL